MAGKGLGTGLSALFGDAAFDNENVSDFDYLPISRVEPRKDQPRNIFGEESMQELADSISEHGMLQPLTVRELNNGYYQIIAGERRWRAARMAGLKEVPARIIEADDKKATELAMVENLQREGLNPIEEALGYKQLMDDYQMTQEEISRRVGKSRPVIANALRLLSLPKILLDKLEAGELSPGAARAILSLESEDDMLSAADMVISQQLNVRQVEQLVKKLKQSKVAPKQEEPKNDGIVVDYMREVERQLTAGLGRKVKVSDGKRRGKIEIDYYGHEDFEKIYDALLSLNLAKEQDK